METKIRRFLSPAAYACLAVLGLFVFGAHDLVAQEAMFENRLLEISREELKKDLTAARMAIRNGRPEQAVWLFSKILREYRMPLPATARLHHDRARLYLQMGRYDEAQNDLEAALRKDASFAEAAALMAQVQLETGDPEQGLTYLQQALRNHSSAPPEWTLLNLRLLAALDRWPQVRSEVRRAPDAVRESPQLYEVYGMLEDSGGRYEQAAAWYEQATAVTPDSVPLHLRWAEALRKSEQPEQALAVAEKIIGEKPEELRAFHVAGLSLLTLNRNEEAEERLTTVLASSPDRADVRVDRALARMRMAALDSALEDTLRAVDLRADWGTAWRRHGSVLMAMDAYGPALKALNRALELEPGSASIRTLKGLLFQREGKAPAALREYNKVLDQQPDLALVLGLRARLHLLGKRYAAARRDAEKAVRHQPDSGFLHTVLARYFEETLQPDKAVFHYNRAVELGLKEDGFWGRARVRDRSGWTEQAVQDFQELLDVAPERETARLQLARLYLQQGRMTEALEAIRPLLNRESPPEEAFWIHARVLADAGDFPEVLDQLSAIQGPRREASDFHVLQGDALSALGRWEEAEAAYQAALEQFPGDAEAWAGMGEAALKLDKPAGAFRAFLQLANINEDHPRAESGRREAFILAGLDPEQSEFIKDWESFQVLLSEPAYRREP